ncbi:GNAT family N-acetyltransferase [Xenorhabdus innexi]|uniref:Acetyltransferase n=1 Tax=Xenorhabdus innexi TaxID=290109 RepID=A0A1N6MUR8_9GAMM|nr:GNAT family N-acetyltransferase [Xenorhabdus innexi]PHM35837.1 ribosomal-protein-S18-alanine acetyltransferase [Xenorhabdus innexi]SIP72552.1 Acetyltransferase [Xenorhabdus innexi]
MAKNTTALNPISVPNIMLLNSINAKCDELINLLHNCVEDGASIGFIPPLEINEAAQYWQDVEKDLVSGNRLLLVAMEDNNIAGSVQLCLCRKKNGKHRADVEKLMVHTDYRRRGIGNKLMDELERLAQQHQRSLLILDTRTNDPASALYRKCGFIEIGQIPNYVIHANGELSATTYFYKMI